jgi:arylsulfatase A-like enzyme
VTVATVMKKTGYTTGCSGKWGLGDPGTTGVPSKQGFDHFFGFLNHTHAHNYYPDHLWRHEEKVPLKNVQEKGVASKRVEYAADLITADALAFVEKHKDRPFFLYYAPTLPHANNEKNRADGNGNEVPDDKPYTNEDWPQPEKNKAAMITRLDADVGTLLAKLKELGLEENTVVIFSSDNGPHREGGNTIEFFASNGPLRGFKRSLTDGGIRVPTIVRWPGVVKAGTTSDHVWAFWDFFPTACEIAGAPVPKGLDGISFLPTLTGKGEQKAHNFLYWEFHEGGTEQAVRHGNWKAIRLAPRAPLELYDLANDPGEKWNVAKDNPEVVAKVEDYLKTARTESKDWPIREPKKKK